MAGIWLVIDTIRYTENTILRRRYNTLALTIISKSAIYRGNCDISTYHYHPHRATVDTAKPQWKRATKDHLEKKSRPKCGQQVSDSADR